MQTTSTGTARFMAVLLATAVVAACGVQEQNAPALTGPSGLMQSVTLSASPDRLPRDGASQSTITVTVQSNGQPASGQRLVFDATGGTLSTTQATTNAAGQATVTVTAPHSSTPSSNTTIDVFATPVEPTTNAPVSTTRAISIALTGALNTTAPTPSFTIDPAAPARLQQTVFDASATQDEGVVCTSCTYTWDFGGESTASGRVVTYQFQTVRTYPVTLTVVDAGGTSVSLSRNVPVSEGTAPSASFSFSPSAPTQAEPVNFTAGNSRVGVPGRTIVSYEWQFGDGTTGSGLNVQHAYAQTGTYVVTLTVTDNAGTQGTATQTVGVSTGLTAAFTFSPTSPLVGQGVTFNATSSRAAGGFSIVEYIWHFGKDEATVTTQSPIASTTYGTEGVYTVTLTVVDSAGRRQTTSQTVTITAPAP
jgi:PKD repeat protein